ncbi:hypothetical protein BWQ96_00821 [Gracilariopsis chorda]|uniref:Uncharacterized protein n=1 Tax=Gracilariopsis chorda TaxID=448386 RepID=A0A2V3J528_9FLOR|nr:hypothetical protein BWQ96_00821 [Gracilariopsis chorda]|eukprot:PXF49505.1 hypothetical protein BWQ96_00821 [Gracilariopsis chorda]
MTSSSIANPAPLGLIGFATACIVNAIAKLCNTQQSSALFITGIAFFGGGGAQILASTLQFIRNEGHSALVFAVFGFHWWNTGLWYMMLSHNPSLAENVPNGVRAAYPAVLATVTAILWIPTLRCSYVSAMTLALVVGAFVVDIPAQWGCRQAAVASAVFALAASGCAVYSAAAEVVNGAWKRDVLPRFYVRKKVESEEECNDERFLASLVLQEIKLGRLSCPKQFPLVLEMKREGESSSSSEELEHICCE